MSGRKEEEVNGGSPALADGSEASQAVSVSSAHLLRFFGELRELRKIQGMRF